jgi:Xaa-Pro aminopeptidase
MLLNKERALELMNDHDVVAIVGTTHENVTYLTGHIGWARRVYRSVASYGALSNDPDRGSALVFDNGQEGTYYSGQGTFAELVRWFGEPNAIGVPAGYQPATDEEARYLELMDTSTTLPTGVDAVAAALRELGVTRGRIAVDEIGCRPEFLAALRERLPGCEIVPGSGLFLMIRLVKTPEELERLRAAARINEAGLTAMLRRMAPGVTENDAVAAWREEVARPGGMWHWCHLGSGPHRVDIFPPTDRELQPGDLFAYDAGLWYRNYNADTGGCGIVGDPTDQALHEYRAIEDGVQEALEVVREGVTVGQIFDRMVEAIKRHGYPAFEATFAGHTIGLEAREVPFVIGPEQRYDDPFLPPTSEFPIPANAVLNIEAPFGVFGYGAYQYEISVVVQQNGWEPLIERDRQGFTIIGG